MERLRKYLIPDDYYRLQFELKGYEVDWDKAIDYIESKNLSNINKPSAYIRTMIVREVKENGKFLRSVEINGTINLSPLFNDLRKLGVEVIQDDTIYIDLLINSLIDVGSKLEDITELLVKAVSLMKEGDTTEKFKTILNNSRLTLTSTINFEALNERYEEEKDSWKKLVESFKEIV